MKRAIVGFMVALVMLTGCGVSEGTVYSKQYFPQHTKTVMVDDYTTQMTYNYTTKQWQTQQVWVGQHPEPRIVPACYEIKFKNSKGDTGSDCIGSDYYNTIRVGDFYER